MVIGRRDSTDSSLGHIEEVFLKANRTSNLGTLWKHYAAHP